MLEFHLSQVEITRRKKAFSALTVFLVIGLSIELSITYHSLFILITTTLIFAIFFFLFGLWTFKLLDKHGRTIIKITSQKVFKEGIQGEEIDLNKVSCITYRKTSNGGIRFLSLSDTGSKKLIFDGVEEFVRFKDTIIGHCPNAKIIELREFINFDHLLFYPILGLLLGFALSYTVIVLAGAGADRLYCAVALYASLVGIFFIINRPIAKRYGRKNQLSDIVWGMALIILAILILLAK